MNRKCEDTVTEAQTKALGYFNADAWLQQPNGTFLVEAGCARDHADMRAGQLSSLLMLMRVDDARGFRMLGDGVQANVMWLASQLADELKGMLPIVAEEARQEARA
jgi:hypothetical protein